MSEGPILNATCTLWTAYTPLATSTPASLPVKLTCVPGDQYLLGLNSTVLFPSQYQAPTIGRDVVMLSERSTALRFLMLLLNVRTIGIPTPYAWLLASSTETWTTLRGVSVRNELVAVTLCPLAPSAVATTVYLVDGSRCDWLRQTVPPPVSPPATGTPAAITCTPLRRPPLARTMICAPGRTARIPLVGVIVSLAASALTSVALCVVAPAEHPATAAASAATAAVGRQAPRHAELPRDLFTNEPRIPVAAPCRGVWQSANEVPALLTKESAHTKCVPGFGESVTRAFTPSPHRVHGRAGQSGGTRGRPVRSRE